MSKPKNQQTAACKHTSASPHVNVQDIKSFKTIIPPFHIQQQFAKIVQKYEYIRFQFYKTQYQGEQLFQSLAQRAFQGEL
jgi:type I restriction enzyme S subunit